MSQLKFGQLALKAASYLPLALLLAIDILWTCNLGDKFLASDQSSEIPAAAAAGDITSAIYPPRLNLAISLQLIALISLVLCFTLAIFLAHFRVHIGQQLLQNLDLAFLLYLDVLLIASFSVHSWHALSIKIDEQQVKLDDETMMDDESLPLHMITLILVLLELLYAITLTVVAICRKMRG